MTKNCSRKETITAEECTELIAFGAEDIEKNLGRSLPIIILRNNAKKALLEDKNFKLLSKELLEKAIDCFKIRNMQPGDFAFKEGDFCKNKLLFVIEGDYELTRKQEFSSIYGSQSASS